MNVGKQTYTLLDNVSNSGLLVLNVSGAATPTIAYFDGAGRQNKIWNDVSSQD